MTASELGRWEPAGVDEVAALFARHRGPWWIAGGIAIELAVGRSLRPHGDIDVALLRSDHPQAHALLPGWELWAVDPPGDLRPWRPGERLPDPVHDVWCRPGATAPWRIQLMIDESDGRDWISRRDRRVRRPLDRLVRRTDGGIPFLAPEVQLYYKSKGPRPQDHQDLHAVLPTLTVAELDWLERAIVRTRPDHPWLPLLRAWRRPAG